MPPPRSPPHLTDTTKKETSSKTRNFCPHCGQKISECECTDTDTEPEAEPQWPCEACGETNERTVCPTCYQKLCYDCFPPVCHKPCSEGIQPCNGQKASKVWFLTRDSDNETRAERHRKATNYKLLSYFRTDSKPSHPQIDTFGGRMDAADQDSFAACARRELREEAYLEPSWMEAAEACFASHPEGHRNVYLKPKRAPSQLNPNPTGQDRQGHAVAHWFVVLDESMDETAVCAPRLTREGQQELQEESAAWRSSTEVEENLQKVVFLRPLAAVSSDSVRYVAEIRWQNEPRRQYHAGATTIYYAGANACRQATAGTSAPEAGDHHHQTAAVTENTADGEKGANAPRSVVRPRTAESTSVDDDAALGRSCVTPSGAHPSSNITHLATSNTSVALPSCATQKRAETDHAERETSSLPSRDDGITSSHPCYLATSGPQHREVRCNGELCMFLESPEDKGEKMVPIAELLQAQDDRTETNELLEERSSWYRDTEKELVEAHELRALIIRLLKENGGGLRNEVQTADNLMRCEPKMTRGAHRKGPQQFAKYIDAFKRERMQDEGAKESATEASDVAGRTSAPLPDAPPRQSLEGEQKCVACWKLAKRSCYTCRKPYCDTCGKSESHRTACSANTPEDPSYKSKSHGEHDIQAIECDDDECETGRQFVPVGEAPVLGGGSSAPNAVTPDSSSTSESSDPIWPPVTCERCGEEAENTCNTCKSAYCDECQIHHTCAIIETNSDNLPITFARTAQCPISKQRTSSAGTLNSSASKEAGARASLPCHTSCASTCLWCESSICRHRKVKPRQNWCECQPRRVGETQKPDRFLFHKEERKAGEEVTATEHQRRPKEKLAQKESLVRQQLEKASPDDLPNRDPRAHLCYQGLAGDHVLRRKKNCFGRESDSDDPIPRSAYLQPSTAPEKYRSIFAVAVIQDRTAGASVLMQLSRSPDDTSVIRCELPHVYMAKEETKKQALDRTLTEEFPISKALRKSARQKKWESKDLENDTATAVSTHRRPERPKQPREMVHTCTVYLTPETADRLTDHRGEINTEVSFQWVTLPNCLSWMEGSAESHVYGSSLRAAIRDSPGWVRRHLEWLGTPDIRIQRRNSAPRHLSVEEPWLRHFHLQCTDMDSYTHASLAFSPTAEQTLASLQTLEEVNDATFHQVRQLAMERAARRGVQRVSPRDVRDASTSLLASKPITQSKHPPLQDEHLKEIDKILADVKATVDQSVAAGYPRPRVLMLGERTGTGARRWTQAGAQVVTNDLDESEEEGIAHAQVPAVLVQDLGFDFIYGCPPCDYLSNASVSRLHVETGRFEAMLEAAGTFKRWYQSRAPLVVMENSKMHPYARRVLSLTPNEIVRPFEHGHPETKAVCLFKLGGLPKLKVTKAIPGREHRLANLGPGLGRGASRGRSFDGVMAAMASQWMSSVLEVAMRRKQSNDYRTVEDLLSAAPGLHPQVALRYENPKAGGKAGRLKSAISKGVPKTQLTTVDVESKTRAEETRLKTDQVVAALDASLGVRLREEDPPEYAVPETRQFRRKKGIWYAWSPRNEPLGAQPVGREPPKDPLFAWRKLRKEDQRSCGKIVHRLSIPAESKAGTGDSARREAGSGDEEPTLHEETPEGRSATEAYEYIGKDMPPRRKTGLPALTQWRTEVEAISRGLSEIKAGNVGPPPPWELLVDSNRIHGSASEFNAHGRTQKPVEEFLQTEETSWSEAIRCLVRAVNRQQIIPTSAQSRLVEAFLLAWESRENTRTRVAFPVFSASLELLQYAFRNNRSRATATEAWCDQCYRACESTCRNVKPVTCGAWACRSETCQRRTEFSCACQPTSPDGPEMDFVPKANTPAAEILQFKRGIVLKDSSQLTAELPLWSTANAFIDPREDIRYTSVGQFLAVQQARILGHPLAYHKYKSLGPEERETPPEANFEWSSENVWEAVCLRWAAYGTYLKFSQNKQLGEAIRAMPPYLLESSTSEGSKSSRKKGAVSRSVIYQVCSQALMMARETMRGERGIPLPPPLIAEITGQLDANEEIGGRCSECTSMCVEILPCLMCDKQLCQHCHAPQFHGPCNGPRLAPLSPLDKMMEFPQTCVPHASRLGRSMLNKMSWHPTPNKHSKEAADIIPPADVIEWPPPPTEDEKICLEDSECTSCKKGREACRRGLGRSSCRGKAPNPKSEEKAPQDNAGAIKDSYAKCFVKKSIMAPLIMAVPEPTSFRLELLMQVIYEGVLGSIQGLNVATSKRSCITDPAGLDYIQRKGPREAGGASGAIYEFINIKTKASFPGRVRKAVDREGAATYQRYGVHHVIHAVGPDLRSFNDEIQSDKKATEDNVLERLKSTYSNVIGAWLRSGIPLLRLPPISAGIFSGNFTAGMPRLTCMALRRAIQELSPDEAQTMQERVKATEGEYPIQLCIHEKRERPFYEEALRSAERWDKPMPVTAKQLDFTSVASLAEVTQELYERTNAMEEKEPPAEGPSKPKVISLSEIREQEWKDAVLKEVGCYLAALTTEGNARQDDEAASEAPTDFAGLEEANLNEYEATFDETDVSDVSSPMEMPACCAYFEDFRIASVSMDGSLRGSYRIGAGRWLSTIADSGSGNNVISSQVLESLPDDAAVDFVRKPPQVLLRSANGQDVVVNGRATITFTLNSYAFKASFMVIDKGQLCILGNDFIARNGGCIQPALHLHPTSKGTVHLMHPRGVDGWIEATLVSSIVQLRQQGLTTASLEEETAPSATKVAKFILLSPDEKSVFCWTRADTKQYDFPGGKAEAEESHAEAGLRELKEEFTETSYKAIKTVVEEAIRLHPDGMENGSFVTPDGTVNDTAVWLVTLPEVLKLETAEKDKHLECKWRDWRGVLRTFDRRRLAQPDEFEYRTPYGALLASAMNKLNWYNLGPGGRGDWEELPEVASLTSMDGSSLKTQPSKGGGADADAVDATVPAVPYGTEVGPELGPCEGEIEGNLPAAPKDGKVTSEQRIKEFEYLLYHVTPIVIPAKTETTVMLPAPKRLLEFKGPLLIEPAPDRVKFRSNVQTAYGISYVSNGKIAVRLINNTHHADSLPSLAPIARVKGETITVIDQRPDTDPTGNLTPEYAEAIADLHVDGHCQKGCESCDMMAERRLTDAQRTAAYRLLAKRAHAFAVPPYKTPGQSHAIEVELPLKENAKPFKCAASRVGDVGNEIIAKAVADMERHHIIEKSNSPWASRVVLVKKKDGQPRFCVDLRRLNELLLVQDSPLPRCDDAIEQLGRATAKLSGAVHYHTLDLTAGFWALNVKPEHRERTAFVTNMGKWQFRRLPFGLRSGPSYMQRLMESTLEGLSWDICLPYLDDIAIWASGPDKDTAFEQALSRLDLVLERLEWAGLTCKPTKCTLFAAQVEYLGHVCSQEGVSLDPAKIQGVKDIKAESITTLEKVRSFLGLCGYYRRHVENYHVKSAPLVELTKAGNTFPECTQTTAVQEAIETLKEALCANPVLAYPRRDREFIVKSDAATGHGIGAVLIQRDDPDEEGQPGQERPVCYYGRKFNAHEANYSATEAELLGVVEAIKQFRPYLWGRRFRVVTDHAALRWLHTMNGTQEGGPQSRLTRWVIRLQEYNFYVEHKPGKHHVDCDAISRLVCALTTSSDSPRKSDSENISSWSHKEAEDLIGPRGDEGKIYSHEELYRECRLRLDNESRTRLPSMIETDPDAEKPPVLAAIEEAPDTQKKAKVPARHAVRTESPMAQFFTPLPLTEGGIPRKDGTPLENDGSAAQAADIPYLQRQDKKCLAIVTYLTSGVTPADQKLASFVRQHARHCSVKNGVLFRIVRLHAEQENETELLLLWIPEECQQSYLHAFHAQLGHQGRERTWQALRRQVFWPSSYQDVADHVMKCHECSFSKQHRTTSRAIVPAIGKYPFDLCTVDLVDMVHAGLGSTDGYKKCLVFVDSLSRWVEAIPLKAEPTAIEYMQLLHEHVVLRYGPPRALRSDRGSNLAAKIIKAYSTVLGTNMLVSKAHHHESAASVERFNKTLIEMVRTVDPGGLKWEKWLPFLLYCYHATPHRVTGESPAYLLYGRELRGPSDAVLNTQGLLAASRQAAEVSVRKLRVAWRLAEAATLKQQVADKSDRDRKMEAPPLFKPDDRVLVRREMLQAKLEDLYDGPFRVISGPDERGNYKLRDLHNNHMHDEIAVSRLKLYSAITDVDRLAPDEYIVEAILEAEQRPLANRGPTSTKVPHLMIKWRGYPKRFNTWEPRSALMLRCSDMVQAFEATRGYRAKASTAAQGAPSQTQPEQTTQRIEVKDPEDAPGEAEDTQEIAPQAKDSTDLQQGLAANYADINREQKKSSQSAKSRSSRLASQPRRNYSESRPPQADPRSVLASLCLAVRGPKPRERSTSARKRLRQSSSWMAGRWWTRLTVAMPSARDDGQERWAQLAYWIPVARLPENYEVLSSQPQLKVSGLGDHPFLAPATEKPSPGDLLALEEGRKNVFIVFSTKGDDYFSWYQRNQENQELELTFPGGKVTEEDYFYSSQGVADPVEAYVQASHRMLQSQLLHYPWAVRELVEQVLLKTPAGHLEAEKPQGHSRLWLVVTPEHFDASPRDTTAYESADWRGAQQFSHPPSLTPSHQEESTWEVTELTKVGINRQPEAPKTIDVFAPITIDKPRTISPMHCFNCRALTVERCSVCLWGICCLPNSDCFACSGQADLASKVSDRPGRQPARKKRAQPELNADNPNEGRAVEDYETCTTMKWQVPNCWPTPGSRVGPALCQTSWRAPIRLDGRPPTDLMNMASLIDTRDPLNAEAATAERPPPGTALPIRKAFHELRQLVDAGYSDSSLIFIATARQMIQAMGAAQANTGTFKAIYAVLRREEYNTDEQAWQIHGASARTYQLWKQLLTQLENGEEKAYPSGRREETGATPSPSWQEPRLINAEEKRQGWRRQPECYTTVPKDELVQAYDNLITVVRLNRPEGEFQDAARKVCREVRPKDYEQSVNPKATTFAAIRAVIDTHLHPKKYPDDRSAQEVFGAGQSGFKVWKKFLQGLHPKEDIVTGTPAEIAVEAMIMMATNEECPPTEAGKTTITGQWQPDYPGQLRGEHPWNWAQRADATMSQVFEAVQNGVQLNNGKITLLDEQIIANAGSSKLAPLEPFFGTKTSLRETAAQWTLCTILSRVAWPTIIRTDLEARQYCPAGITVRSISRWNARIREFNEELHHAMSTPTGDAQIRTGQEVELGPQEIGSASTHAQRPELRLVCRLVGTSCGNSLGERPVRKRKENDPLEEEEPLEHIADFVRTATTKQMSQRLQKWRFQEPALKLIANGTKTIDARFSNRGVSRALSAAAGKECYVLASSHERECIVQIHKATLHDSFGEAYTSYRRALVPESWCPDDTPDAIQKFYEKAFYKGKETLKSKNSVICFEVECIRMLKQPDPYLGEIDPLNTEVIQFVSTDPAAGSASLADIMSSSGALLLPDELVDHGVYDPQHPRGRAPYPRGRTPRRRGTTSRKQPPSPNSQGAPEVWEEFLQGLKKTWNPRSKGRYIKVHGILNNSTRRFDDNLSSWRDDEGHMHLQLPEGCPDDVGICQWISDEESDDEPEEPTDRAPRPPFCRRCGKRADPQQTPTDIQQKASTDEHNEERAETVPKEGSSGASFELPPPGGDQFQWDDAVMIQNLQGGRRDLNNRAARVMFGICKRGRFAVEMVCGQEQLWVKPMNLTLIPPCTDSLTEEPFVRMPSDDTAELAMFFLANQGSFRVPGMPMRMMPLRTMAPTEETPTPSTPPSPPSSPQTNEYGKPSTPEVSSRRSLSALELGLAKARSDCVNGDGAAGHGTYFSPPASPSYSPEPSETDGEVNTLTLEDIADLAVAQVAAEDRLAEQQAQTQAAQPELRATELAMEVWERLQGLLPPPLVSPSRGAVLRQAEFFLSGEYHLRHVMVHAADQVVTHFLLKEPDAMEEAAGVIRQRRSDAGQSSDAGPSQMPQQRMTDP